MSGVKISRVRANQLHQTAVRGERLAREYRAACTRLAGEMAALATRLGRRPAILSARLEKLTRAGQDLSRNADLMPRLQDDRSALLIQRSLEGVIGKLSVWRGELHGIEEETGFLRQLATDRESLLEEQEALRGRLAELEAGLAREAGFNNDSPHAVRTRADLTTALTALADEVGCLDLPLTDDPAVLDKALRRAAGQLETTRHKLEALAALIATRARESRSLDRQHEELIAAFIRSGNRAKTVTEAENPAEMRAALELALGELTARAADPLVANTAAGRELLDAARGFADEQNARPRWALEQLRLRLSALRSLASRARQERETLRQRMAATDHALVTLEEPGTPRTSATAADIVAARERWRHLVAAVENGDCRPDQAGRLALTIEELTERAAREDEMIATRRQQADLLLSAMRRLGHEPAGEPALDPEYAEESLRVRFRLDARTTVVMHLALDLSLLWQIEYAAPHGCADPAALPSAEREKLATAIEKWEEDYCRLVARPADVGLVLEHQSGGNTGLETVIFIDQKAAVHGRATSECAAQPRLHRKI